LEDNGKRDRRVHTELQLCGWRVMTIWECSFRQSGLNRERKLDSLALRARTFLLSARKSLMIPEPIHRKN
jgi:G:T-mismatch repair DNA endonuclease (very short patch repair protein)